MTTHARTERLLLRNWSMTDVDAYAGIVADPEVMRYIGDGKPRGRGHAEAFVRTMMRHQEERGWMLLPLSMPPVVISSASRGSMRRTGAWILDGVSAGSSGVEAMDSRLVLPLCGWGERHSG